VFTLLLLSRTGQMIQMKTFSISCALLLSCSVSLEAGERIVCKSPDGRFALRETFADTQPYHGDTAIVETGTHKVVAQLNTDQPPADKSKLVWSDDSRRLAYFREYESGSTRIFFRNGLTFDEIKLPELPPTPKTNGADGDAKNRVEPIRWLKSGDLLLQNRAGGRAALEITLGFDKDNRPVVRKSEQEKTSIVDYFLLLPPDNFEGPPSVWLKHIQSENNVIDKENGYMKSSGDGAQAEFEVALFRYRDGRPLLAVCSGVLEVADAVVLRFFEMGPDGKMDKIRRTILPGADIKYDPDVGYEKDDWQFELPRKGRTIVVRSEKTKKILRKFTWNGEKFQEEK
jgi:hypothetical protein